MLHFSIFALVICARFQKTISLLVLRCFLPENQGTMVEVYLRKMSKHRILITDVCRATFVCIAKGGLEHYS